MPETPIQKTIPDATAMRNHLVGDFLNAQAAIAKHREKLAQLAEQLIAELGVGGRHEIIPAGDGQSAQGVRVQAPAATFDAVKAQRVLTAEQYAAICEPKPSASLASAVLPGVLVDQCRTTGSAPSVRAL